MNRPLLAVVAVWLASLVAWSLTLAQLSTPRHASIPDRSTQTQFPGP
jgi:hypothetical protein